MLTIWEFKNGYCAVGKEACKKWFVPDIEAAVFICEVFYGKHVGLTSSVKIRKIDRDFEYKEV